MQPNQQQPPVIPTNNQVPDQRLDQIMREMRELRDQNQQLRGTIDTITRRTPAPAPNAPPVFEEKVDKAIDAKFRALLAPEQEKFQMAVGYMNDRVDQAEFRLKHMNSRYTDYLPDVEAEEQRLQRNSQWVPREQILQKLQYDDAGKRLRPEKTAEQVRVETGPKFDPYTNQWLGQDGKPVQATQPPAQQYDPQNPYAQVTQPPPLNPGYQPQPQPPYFPTPPAQSWQPNLPPSAPLPPGQQASLPVVSQGLDLQRLDRMDPKARDQQLDSWSDRYGDTPI